MVPNNNMQLSLWLEDIQFAACIFFSVSGSICDWETAGLFGSSCVGKLRMNCSTDKSAWTCLCLFCRRVMEQTGEIRCAMDHILEAERKGEINHDNVLYIVENINVAGTFLFIPRRIWLLVYPQLNFLWIRPKVYIVVHHTYPCHSFDKAGVLLVLERNWVCGE